MEDKILEDIQKNKEIEQQVERWDIMAKIVPTTFLLISASLTVWGWITLDTAFYIGLSIFAVTSVILVVLDYFYHTLSNKDIK